MRLELTTYQVNKITLAPGTRYCDGLLQVDEEEVRSLVVDDVYFSDVRLHVVHPGESVRIIHAIDVVEPRYKASGPGCVFPGVLGPPVQVGEGRTLSLDGMSIISTAGLVPGETFYWREAIVDMSGPGALYTPFSQTANLVVELISREPGPGVPAKDLEVQNTIRGSKYAQDWNIAVRRVGFKLASCLAEAVQGLPPDREEVYMLDSVNSSLPKIMCAIEVLGDLLYGSLMGWQPTLLHPNELMDGCPVPALQHPCWGQNRSLSDAKPSGGTGPVSPPRERSEFPGSAPVSQWR